MWSPVICTMHDNYGDNYNDCACNSGVDGVQYHSRTSENATADITDADITINDATVTMDLASVNLQDEDVVITIGNVLGKKGGPETRPKNMLVIYIMRVW